MVALVETWWSGRATMTGATVVVVLLARVVLAASGVAQPPAEQPVPRLEPGLAIEAVGFCSETRPRTSNARLTWRAGATALGAGVTSLAATTQRLETTVFKNGFERGLFVALPIGAAGADRGIAAVAQTPAAQQLASRRAFQIRITVVNAARPAETADGGSEMDAVVENLEPGVNYIWRLAIDGPAGRIASRPVTLRAPICPTDGAEPPPSTPPRRRP
jgi:hypothetical protein